MAAEPSGRTPAENSQALWAAYMANDIPSLCRTAVFDPDVDEFLNVVFEAERLYKFDIIAISATIIVSLDPGFVPLYEIALAGLIRKSTRTYSMAAKQVV